MTVSGQILMALDSGVSRRLEVCGRALSVDVAPPFVRVSESSYSATPSVAPARFDVNAVDWPGRGAPWCFRLPGTMGS